VKDTDACPSASEISPVYDFSLRTSDLDCRFIDRLNDWRYSSNMSETNLLTSFMRIIKEMFIAIDAALDKGMDPSKLRYPDKLAESREKILSEQKKKKEALKRR